MPGEDSAPTHDSAAWPAPLGAAWGAGRAGGEDDGPPARGCGSSWVPSHGLEQAPFPLGLGVLVSKCSESTRAVFTEGTGPGTLGGLPFSARASTRTGTGEDTPLRRGMSPQGAREGGHRSILWKGPPLPPKSGSLASRSPERGCIFFFYLFTLNFFLIFFFWPHRNTQEFLSQGLNPSHSSDKTESLTCETTRELRWAVSSDGKFLPGHHPHLRLQLRFPPVKGR